MGDDGMKTVGDGYVKRIHSKKHAGKIHKGHNITTANSSIPSKYQTIVTDNSEKNGFLSQCRRFNYDNTSDNPGPGNYVSHEISEKDSPSFSKRGTGGFASKDRRVMKPRSSGSPGPAYSLPTLLTTRKDFNKSSATSVFQKPIANPTEDRKSTPAPNQYDASRGHGVTGKTNNVAADAAFKSKSRREILDTGDAKRKPAPWQYHVRDELVKESVKVPYSSFKSKSVRKIHFDAEPIPGPGTYFPNEEKEPVPRTVFPRKHYLCISAPAMPLPATLPPPGPGSYELGGYMGPEKHYMSSSMFVSTTGRWTGDVKNPDVPGPAHYRPVGVGKQSFIYNAVGRWI